MPGIPAPTPPQSPSSLRTPAAPKKPLGWIIIAIVAIVTVSTALTSVAVLALWRLGVTSGTVANNTPTPTNGPTAANESKPPINESSTLTEKERVTILSQDRAAIEKMMRDSQTRRDRVKYQTTLMKFAAAQGRSDSLSMVIRQSTLTTEEMNQLTPELMELAYQAGHFELINVVVRWKDKTGDLSQASLPFVLRTFRKDPFDPKRFEAMIRICNVNCQPVFEEALNSSPERWQWAASHYQKNQYNLDLNQIKVNNENIDRLLDMMVQSKRLDHAFIVKHLKLLDSPRFDRMLPAANSLAIFNDLADHVLTLDPQTVMRYFEQHQGFRNYLSNTLQSIRLDTPNTLADLAKFKTVFPAIQKLSESSEGWNLYRQPNRMSLEVYDWLWQAGLRPTRTADTLAAVYVGVRNKDVATIAQARKWHQDQDRASLANGFDVFLTQADLIVGKRDTFLPLYEIIRQGDLRVLEEFCQFPETKTNWPDKHPVLMAMADGRTDMAEYLLQHGFTLNDAQRAEALKLNNVDLSILAPSTGRGPNQTKRSRTSASSATELLKAVRAGDLDQVDAALKTFPFRTGGADDLPGTPAKWHKVVEVGLILNASIAHPKIMSRLQFEGFPYSFAELNLAISTKNVNAIKVLMRDASVRDQLRENADVAMNLINENPAICKALVESGVVDELSAETQVAIRKAAQY